MSEKIRIEVERKNICTGKLHDGESRYCAIGHLLHALGVKDEAMMGTANVSDMVRDLDDDVMERLESMGIIDSDDPGRDDDDDGYHHTIDTNLTENIYGASDGGDWGGLRSLMAEIGVEFIVTDAPPEDD